MMNQRVAQDRLSYVQKCMATIPTDWLPGFSLWDIHQWQVSKNYAITTEASSISESMGSSPIDHCLSFITPITPLWRVSTA